MTKKIKALVKKEAKTGLWMEEVPLPTPKDNEVLIKTVKSSICGTDLHIYKWDAWAQRTVPVPMVIGHEFMGVVAAVGKNVTQVKEGDRVCGEGHLVCGHCPSCRMGRRHLCMNTEGTGYDVPGTFAEYFTFPESNLFPLPATISDDLGAIFDPYGNAVHTAMYFPLTGEDVLIAGAGPIGIMAAAIARKAGARHVVITDKNPYRLNLATKLGATRAVNIDETSMDKVIEELGIEYGFTVGMEMSGNPHGLNTLLEKVRHGGKIALLGILPAGAGINWDLVIFKMLTLQGIYGRKIFDTWYEMTHLLESGLDLAPVITHQYPIDQFEEGFKTMLSGNCGKVILNWNN